MRAARGWIAAVGALLLLAGRAEARDLVLGYNQAWIDGAYGHDLTDRFDADAWRRVLRRTREGGGSVLRVWLLEGQAKEGVLWSGHRPDGLDPRLLEGMRRLVAMALEERVQLYWTLTSANWPSHWDRRSLEAARQWNICNDRYGYRERWLEVVVAPLVQVMAERPEATWGVDLMNEVQGSVRAWFWPDGWQGARRHLRALAAFVHARCAGLRLTVSCGHHTAADDILEGRLDGLGLDFLDVHVYTDDGRIPRGRELALHARRAGVPIVVGEFGQRSEQRDDALQARVAAGIIADARRLGFAAAFAWRLEDAQSGGARFSFYDGDRPRPALEVLRRAGTPAPRPVVVGPAAPQGASRGALGALDAAGR